MILIRIKRWLDFHRKSGLNGNFIIVVKKKKINFYFFCSFGDVNSKDYKIKFQKHREFIVNKLYTFTMAFIDSINSNLFCFPSSLGWLVSHVYNLLTKVSPKTSISQQQQQQHDVN
jgi:hypothetical protein